MSFSCDGPPETCGCTLCMAARPPVRLDDDADDEQGPGPRGRNATKARLELNVKGKALVVDVEKLPDGRWSASTPALPGVTGIGVGLAEAFTELRRLITA